MEMILCWNPKAQVFHKSFLKPRCIEKKCIKCKQHPLGLGEKVSPSQWRKFPLPGEDRPAVLYSIWHLFPRKTSRTLAAMRHGICVGPIWWKIVLCQRVHLLTGTLGLKSEKLRISSILLLVVVVVVASSCRNATMSWCKPMRWVDFALPSPVTSRKCRWSSRYGAQVTKMATLFKEQRSCSLDWMSYNMIWFCCDMLIYIIYHTLQIYTSLYYTLFHGIVLSAFQLLFDSMKVLYLPPFKQHENDPSTNMCKTPAARHVVHFECWRQVLRCAWD